MRRRRQARRARVASLLALLAAAGALLLSGAALAANISVPGLKVEIGGAAGGPAEMASAMRILLLLTVLALAPAILITVTGFVRIVVVLAFLRHALGTQQTPPNQVLIALALFLTAFVMAPSMAEANRNGVEPFLDGQISQDEALERVSAPFRTFMLQQTRETDLALFLDMAGESRPETPADVPWTALLPAFVISELKTAFQMGFLLFLPFLLLDMIIGAILMSMGMMMVPPMMISLPFKVLLFVLADGWYLVVESLVSSFAGGPT